MTWLGEHGSSVMKVARAYTLTSEECQDLAQEILLQAWRSLPNFRGQGKRGDVVLSRGIAHRDELASQGQAAPVTATTFSGGASHRN